ncbi:DJ-1/PfpI family protein [Bacteroides sp. OttesenSCG-928-F21]|nr:DJ-1/PfpI family protein [Bacteroides sp. OttesenSCG-928-F21]
MSTVYMFFANGFEEIEALATMDVLRRASLNAKMVSVTNEKVVTGAHDIPVTCDSLFEECDYSDAEALILPGGMPGAATLRDHDGLLKLITGFSKTNKPIAAICAAPMVLGKLGLLKGKKATCYPGFESFLEGAECTGESVVKDGNIITAIGPGGTMDFALTIVETLIDNEKVQELKEAMCVKG